MGKAKKPSEWDLMLAQALERREPFEYWREPKVLDVSGMPRSTMRALVKQGLFPPPVRITPRISAWPSLLVEAWQRQRAQFRRPA